VERLRILLVTPFPPRIDGTHGGAKAVGGLARALARRHEVGVVTFRYSGEPGVDSELQGALELVQEVPRQTEPTGVRHVARALRRRVELVRGTPLWVSELPIAAGAAALRKTMRRWEPDVVQFEFAVTGGIASAVPPHTARILVDHDPLFPANGRLDRRASERHARRVYRDVDAVVTFTDRDRVAAAARGGDVTTIPLGFELGEPLDPAGKGGELVFVGNLNHPANREAVAHITRDLVPRLTRSRPDVTVTVVGELPSGGPAPQPTADVRFTGLVDDVAPFVDNAAVVLAPLRSGGGMRVKVLEALASGKALVAYPDALTGLDVTPGHDVIVATTSDEFAQHVLALLDDTSRRVQLARNARTWAEANAGWDRIADRYVALYRSVLG
jgi:glycosyltransferase involved in cell wall biosynthesis